MLLCELQSVCCCSCLNAGEHIKKSCLIIQVCFVLLHYLIWAQNIKATLLEPKQLVIQVSNLNKGAVVCHCFCFQAPGRDLPCLFRQLKY